MEGVEPVLPQGAVVADPFVHLDQRLRAQAEDPPLRFLPHDILIDDGTTVRFNRETVEVDARAFEELIGAPSMNSIRKAVEIYRGNLLENFSSGIGPFDAWLAERRLTYWRAALASKRRPSARATTCTSRSRQVARMPPRR